MTGQNNTSFLTILSVFLVLVLLGLYGVVFAHSNDIGKYIKEQLNIVVELTHQTDQNGVNEVINLIKSKEEVISSSVHYVSKNDALDIMATEISGTDMISAEENPFNDAIIFNLKHEYYNQTQVKDLEAYVNALPGVSSMFYEEDFYDNAHSNIQRISILSFILGILLLILAGALIFNTIYLSLVTDESKIRLKELVGAKRRYIKMPYLRKAFRMGWVSALGACIFISLLIYFVASQVPVIKSILNIQYTIVVFVFLFLLGVMIPMIGTNTIVNKYLSKLYTY